MEIQIPDGINKRSDKVLDATAAQKVSYCIPDWLRDEQVRANIRKVKERLEPGPDRTDPIAIVCAGPSLNDTWEKIRDFKYIISMSISGKFLIERGIIPTWHTAVDPRATTVDHIGKPHPDVEYLISSNCHPSVIDHLKGHKIRLWHVFSNQEDALRVLPFGEHLLFGGLNVGLRSLVIAAILGFKDLHVFGLDGNYGKTGAHAAAHCEQAKDVFRLDYDGVTYWTTPAFLEAARQTLHELNQLPEDVKVTFHGDGLTQHMVRNHKREKPKKGAPLLAFLKLPVISEKLRELNAELHRENYAYGIGGGKYAETVLKIAKAIKTESILDYGCGKGLLAKSLPFPIWEYDPAIPGKDESPRPADLVVCTDVLEHVEQENLGPVLLDIARCIKKTGFLAIHIGPAKKTYSDGRNAHLTQQTPEWWERTLDNVFRVTKVGEEKAADGKVVEVRFVVSNKPKLGPSKVSTKAAALPARKPDGSLTVVIGGARKDRIPALVAEYSLRKNATCPLKVIQTWDKKLPTRPCPTGFSFVRFQVSELCGYTGRGMYMDSDMIVYGDVAELARLDMGGKKVVRPKNQSAVMLVDCDLWKWDVEALLASLDRGETDYYGMLVNLWPCNPDDIGDLDIAWNMTDRWDESGKLLHYTRIPTQPWKFPNHPLGHKWREALIEAIKAGAIKPEWVEEDEAAGYLKGVVSQEIRQAVGA